MALLHRVSDNAAVGPFADRHEAGLELAIRLRGYSGRHDVVVLALPRGGVPVGYEVARALDAPLDVFVVSKLRMPGRPEFAIGAIASGGAQVLNEDVVRAYGIPRRVIEESVQREQLRTGPTGAEYRQATPKPDLRGHTVILVDNGLATGSTMRAAVLAVRAQRPARVIMGVPVGAPETCDECRGVADATICPRTPERFVGVGLWYRDFTQTTDEEVRGLLQRSAAEMVSKDGKR